jgi:Ion channel
MQIHFDEFLRRRGSLVLMWVLIAETLASPLADSRPHIGVALALVVLISVLLGARLPVNRKIVIRAAVPVAGLWILARVLEGFSDRPYLFNVLSHCLGFTLSCLILLAIFERLNPFQVTNGVIAEAIISYLIIAIAFSQIYWILNSLLDGSFNQKIAPTQSAEFLYFSMITLTSVGYGGIVPINPFVRLIAAFESMTGIFYVAIVVARLVSSYRSVQDSTTPAEEKR